MSAVSRHLRDVREFIDSAVRYGLPEPTSVGVTRWGDVDIQVPTPDDLDAWAAYCDDAEVAPNNTGTLDGFRFTDDDGFKVHVYSGRRGGDGMITEVLVSADFIEHLSRLHDVELERHTDRAYLRVGKTVFYARLSPVVARDAS